MPERAISLTTRGPIPPPASGGDVIFACCEGAPDFRWVSDFQDACSAAMARKVGLSISSELVRDLYAALTGYRDGPHALLRRCRSRESRTGRSFHE